MLPEVSNEDKFNKWAFHFAMIVTWPLIFLILGRRNSFTWAMSSSHKNESFHVYFQASAHTFWNEFFPSEMLRII